MPTRELSVSRSNKAYPLSLTNSQYPLLSNSSRSGLAGCIAHMPILILSLTIVKEGPKQASAKDVDGRLPIHWATSSNSAEIVQLLSDLRGFDPDVQV